MRIHILGICGTFMGGIAALARELGHEVTGSDANVYPPMSDQLRALGITLQEGYSAAHLQPAPDLVIVGNALSRGNPAIEYMLDARLPYVSGPQWLGENVLRTRTVLAVAGTHGKTTTTSLLAHLLESAGRDPGFLVGGVPGNFGVSARLQNRGQSALSRQDQRDLRRSLWKVHSDPGFAVAPTPRNSPARRRPGTPDPFRRFPAGAPANWSWWSCRGCRPPPAPCACAARSRPAIAGRRRRAAAHPACTRWPDCRATAHCRRSPGRAPAADARPSSLPAR